MLDPTDGVAYKKAGNFSEIIIIHPPPFVCDANHKGLLIQFQMLKKQNGLQGSDKQRAAVEEPSKAINRYKNVF